MNCSANFSLGVPLHYFFGRPKIHLETPDNTAVLLYGGGTQRGSALG